MQMMAPGEFVTDTRVMANALRILAIDAVEQAGSGHPGMPMGMADIATALWLRHLRHNPADPAWPDRDRFILSNGHGSMLQYALLHLSGYDLQLSELRNFRQLGSRTPGHPESGLTPGVETTTGPLGQGIANGVGMALAEALLAAEFNRPGHAIVDHRTFVFAGDGCLMEGISHEACSLAGTLGLEKLVVCYDANGISIDGKVDAWFDEDVAARFAAYGWRVIPDVNGHDPEEVEGAIAAALTPSGRPTLIVFKTVIGWGAPHLAGSHEVHGAALGKSEAEATRRALGWSETPFDIPRPVRNAWDARAQGAIRQRAWEQQLAAYSAAFPELAREFTRRMRGELPADFAARADRWLTEAEGAGGAVATRKASQLAIAKLAGMLPELFGGSADLTGSNLTSWPGCRDIGRGRAGNYLHYGVREFAMAAIVNGVALHEGYLPFAGTFLVFADYARNALRLAALMGIRAVFVFTHDSIGLGEDGPTHQPIEHLASLRLIPGMDVWRPSDVLESAVAWRAAVERKDGPSSLVFSRQAVAQIDATAGRAALARRGGYVLADAPDGKPPDVVLIATGSEVPLAVRARELLQPAGVAARVVSMPSTTVFDRQEEAYRRSVLPERVPRVAVEAGVTDYWRKYVGLEGAAIGLDRFGESAPGPALFAEFGFTPAHVAAVARSLL